MIGKTISHYRILEKLGEGGMGVVYKAEDTKLKRTVALKFLSPMAVGSAEEKTRFLHEAQAAAALDDSNICSVHEIEEAEGQTFIVMAYVEGQSLKEKITAGPLKIDEAIHIAIQIAEGLQAAHEKGIVHRDVKPANVLLNEKGQVRITDFGLAKLAGRTRVTKTGTTMGTVAYMSPEQARGERVDHRTDIWSLGVVLYEMVTGQLPFQGDYEQAVVYSVINEEPEPPTALRSGVPMELERIILKTLAKNPDERYQHVGDLLTDLRMV
ncbi:MAG: serine/threonine protein kinase, partial [Calditrichaeota bacterium]